MKCTRGFGKCERRWTLVALAGMALSIGVALAAAPGGAGTRPATTSSPAGRGVSAANKAAAEAQFKKAYDLFGQEKFADAQVENEKALALDPTNTQALLMRRVLEGKLAGGGAATGTATGGAATGKLSLLTMPQVNLIRAMELQLGEKPVGRFDPKVLEDFWNTVLLKDPTVDKSKANHDDFLNPSHFAVQLRRIRDSNDMKYLQGVTITSEPATLLAFKSVAHTYVLQNCATAECHGDRGQGGNFRLVNPATSPEQQYTNFYILSMYANKDGKMIDRDTSEKSLLLQYGLPYASASIKHPKVEARKLTGLNDPRLGQMNQWIKALAFPKPNYGIIYEVPGTAPAPAATVPATRGTATAPK